MLPQSQRKSSQKRDFELGLHASDHLKNNPPKGRIPKRWDKNPVQEILPEGRIINRVLLIEGYLHASTFYSDQPPWKHQIHPQVHCHYISPPEAMWHILQFSLHGCTPNVCHLLHGDKQVYFDPDHALADVVPQAVNCRIMVDTFIIVSALLSSLPS